MIGYQFCAENALVTAVQRGNGSWSVLIDGKIACSMSSGGAHQFGKRLEAEVFGKHVVRGYTGGTYLSEDLENYLF